MVTSHFRPIMPETIFVAALESNGMTLRKLQNTEKKNPEIAHHNIGLLVTLRLKRCNAHAHTHTNTHTHTYSLTSATVRRTVTDTN